MNDCAACMLPDGVLHQAAYPCCCLPLIGTYRVTGRFANGEKRSLCSELGALCASFVCSNAVELWLRDVASLSGVWTPSQATCSTRQSWHADRCITLPILHCLWSRVATQQNTRHMSPMLPSSQNLALGRDCNLPFNVLCYAVATTSSKNASTFIRARPVAVLQ